EILQEKARISDLAKKLNLSFRAKEIEFRNLEYSLQDEIRRRDDQLKSKTSALVHAKEQIAQMSLSMERLKGKSAGAGGGVNGADKSKAEYLQKTLTVQRDENAKLQIKIEDLRNQLAAAQLAKKGVGGSGDSKELFDKNQLLTKKLEELKRNSRDL